MFAFMEKMRNRLKIKREWIPAFAGMTERWIPAFAGKHSGQAAIFILMMFSLIFMFFGMAINIAMLVHHKINLQNAADMSALSGAAEQGRILNMISWKNYELRKNFKEFMYRYWVQFNDQHLCFPRTNNPAPGAFTAQNCAVPAVPSYCLDVPGQKTCNLRPGKIPTEIPHVSQALLAAAALDPISAALVLQNYMLGIQLSKKTLSFWEKHGIENVQAALKDSQAFKYRSDAIYDTYLNPEFPNTLTSMMNFPQTRGAIPQEWEAFRKNFIENQDPTFRTFHYTHALEEFPYNYHQLAEKTAWNNLNRNLQTGFEFYPLAPADDIYTDIQPVKMSFTIFASVMSTYTGSIFADPLYPINVENMIVGVEKKNPVTFYSVLLKSRPELPFLPGVMPWTLTAVAAAKPFGSRIGPSFHINDFVIPMSQALVQRAQKLGYTIRHPQLPIMKFNETLSINDTPLIRNLKNVLAEFESGAFPPKVELLGPLHSPNQWDILRYNFPDPSTSKGRIHWTDQPTPTVLPFAAKSLSTSWAPEGDPPRAGYSIKLIPMTEIFEYVDPAVQPEILGVEH